MRKAKTSRIAMLAALAAILASAPAEAQGKSKAKNKGKDKDRPELIRRDDGRQSGTILGDIFGTEQRSNKQAPAFCRSGKGHPVHGRQWCVDKGFGLGGGGILNSRGTYDGRYDDRRSGSYDRAHSEFHRSHDRQCRLRAAERPLDPAWQLRVRTDCKQRHDQWHARAGRRH